MFDAISETQANATGLFGAGTYLISYALLQLGFIKGNSYSYALLSMLAASCVMVSLLHAFNMSSFIIQTSFIVISLVGMARLFWMTRMVRFTPEEQDYVDHQVPFLRPHLARQLLDTAVWIQLSPGEMLTTQGVPVSDLAYVRSGQVAVEIDGHRVGFCEPATYIGELTFLARDPATATVVATRPSDCLKFQSAKLRRLLDRDPEVKMALIASFSGDTKDKLLRRNRETIAARQAAE
ncbi:MAG: cyclic nucleotide-binding domain-containing protein [Sedimentitalea sp.]